MLRLRSRLGLALLLTFALATVVVLVAGWIWNSGRLRLERAHAALLASGGSELPPQTPELTEGGKKTAAWFAQFGDEDAWARDELDSTRSIEAFLAAHGTDSSVAPLSAELRTLADALRITEEEVRGERAEIDDPRGSYAQIQALVGGESPDPLESLEYSRASECKRRIRELLEQQQPFESWDELSRAWVRTRVLAHAGMLQRSSELLALEPFDAPSGRGPERWSVTAGRSASAVHGVLLEALPALAIRGEHEFVRVAACALANGDLHSRGWGLLPAHMDAEHMHRSCKVIRECPQFLPNGFDLGTIEASIAAWNPRAVMIEALRRDRAVGNEILVDIRGGSVSASTPTGAKSLVERELVRLWLSHEHAGYLEMMGAALELAPRAPFELSGGLSAYDPITEDIRDSRSWQVIRLMITPDLRREAVFVAQLEVQRQLTLLCLDAWRDPGAVAAKLAETKDPFTGQPLEVREEDGVLVFSSPGDGEPIEARLRLR